MKMMQIHCNDSVGSRAHLSLVRPEPFPKIGRSVVICQVKYAGDMGLCGAWRTQSDRAIVAVGGSDHGSSGIVAVSDGDDCFLLDLLSCLPLLACPN